MKDHKPDESADEQPSSKIVQDIDSPSLSFRQPQPQRSETFDTFTAPSIADSDDDYDEEFSYDWSGEEDLIDEEAKFEEKIGVKTMKKSWTVKRIIIFLFSSLIGSAFLFGVLIAGPILVHFFWYKKDPTPSRRYTMDNIEAWFWWMASNIIVSWFLALLIDLVPAVALLVISIGWGHVSEGVKTTTELYNGVKGTIKPLFYAASAWVSWVILFEGIYKLYDSSHENHSRASYTPRIYEVVRFFFFFTLVISLQRMLSHAVAFAFHRTAFKERLDTVSEALRVIEKLRDYKPRKGHAAKKSSGSRTPVFGLSLPFAEKAKANLGSRPQLATNSADPSGRQDTESSVDDHNSAFNKSRKRKSALVFQKAPLHVGDGGSPHSDATPQKSGANSVEGHDHETSAIVTQAAKVLKTAVLHDARNIRGKEDNGLVWNVSSSREAKRLARSIFIALVDRRRKYLIPSDFYPAFSSHEEAETAFRVFDKDNNGDISPQEIKSLLLRVYKERRFLARSIRDVSAALKTLDRILLLFAFIVLFFISLSVFGVNVTSSLTSVYTIGIAASFVFRSTASGAFDAIMFLFVTHPFDTGDRCFIGTENLVVKKMGLFATVFQRADGTETYYFNSQLFNMFINNARRSEKMFENLTMQVAWRTPLEKLDALISALNEWLKTEENRWFEPSTSLTIQRIDFQRYLECTILIGYNGNWQDWGLRLARKTAFHAAVQFYCRQLGIVLYESPLPVAFADHDTQLHVGPDDDASSTQQSSYPGDKDDPVTELSSPKEKPGFLGFKPPSSKPSLRARKSRSHKTVMSNMGGVP